MRTIQIVIGGIILFPWVVSTTPPLPSPYHQYKVSGIISRDSSGDLRNYVAILYGKRNHDDNRGYMRLSALSSMPKKFEDRIGLSDSTGSFMIMQTSSRGKYDSLMVAVIAPDRPTIFSTPFPVDSNASDEEITYYPDDSGCSCVNSPETTPYIAGYIYTDNTPKNILLPY
jgi:hypothetical protein